MELHRFHYYHIIRLETPHHITLLIVTKKLVIYIGRLRTFPADFYMISWPVRKIEIWTEIDQYCETQVHTLIYACAVRKNYFATGRGQFETGARIDRHQINIWMSDLRLNVICSPAFCFVIATRNLLRGSFRKQFIFKCAYFVLYGAIKDKRATG